MILSLLIALPVFNLPISNITILAPPAIHYSSPITIKVDANNGDSISGVRSFKVLVSTQDIVNKVEWYVNGTVQGDSESTPYVFKLDTVALDDGPITLKFIAYTDQGKQATKSLKLVVDNGMAKGAQFHIDAGNTANQNGNYDEAIQQARVALKADNKNIGAKLVLARAYLLKADYPKAQNETEDILATDAKNLDALNLAGSIGVQEAFNIYDNGSKDSDALSVIKQAFVFAVDSRKSLQDARYDALATKGAPDATHVFDYAYAACAANHFSDAIQVLNPAANKDRTNSKIGDLLAYAQLRSNKMSDALTTLNLMKEASTNSIDAYGDALYGLIYAEQGNSAASDSAMSDAILSNMSDLGVRTAQASIALKENKNSALTSMLNSLASDSGQLTEVDYLASSLCNRIQKYDQARKFMLASLTADPANYLMYVESGNQIIGSVLSTKGDAASNDAQYKTAQMFFQIALEAKGDSYEALTGLSIVSALLKDPASAMSFAKAAVAAQPNYAAGEYALSMAFGLLADDASANSAAAAATQAGKLDPPNLDGAAVPNPGQTWLYFNSGGRSPVITAPSNSPS